MSDIAYASAVARTGGGGGAGADLRCGLTNASEVAPDPGISLFLLSPDSEDSYEVASGPGIKSWECRLQTDSNMAEECRLIQTLRLLSWQLLFLAQLLLGGCL